MGDYERINSMGQEELRQFALFAYTAYPTLLETHEKRQAFAREYPDKGPHRNTTDPNQMELPFVQEVDEKEQ
jgi:hypothetical protein